MRTAVVISDDILEKLDFQFANLVGIVAFSYLKSKLIKRI